MSEAASVVVGVLRGVAREFSAYRTNAKDVKPDVALEVKGMEQILAKCIAHLEEFEGEVPDIVQTTIAQIKRDADQLFKAQKNIMHSSRVKESRAAAERLAQHKILLNTEIIKLDTASMRTAETGQPALDAALQKVRSANNVLADAATGANGAQKLTIKELTLLADHWKITIPSKCKKQGEILDVLVQADPLGKGKKRAPLREMASNVVDGASAVAIGGAVGAADSIGGCGSAGKAALDMVNNMVNNMPMM